MLFQVLLISICLSIDALGIGVSYEIKGVKIGFISRMMIGFMSTLVMYIAQLTSAICIEILSEDIMRIIGGCILVLMGITFIKNGLFGEEAEQYDFNKSCEIEWTEAIVLGLVLSADAFSAGFAISALEISGVIMPVCVGLMQIGFLYAGSFLTKRCHLVDKMNSKLCSIFSGCLLIIIAILKSL